MNWKDEYVFTRPEDYSTFIAQRERFTQSWGSPTRPEDIWNLEGLGFDMTAFTRADGVYGEVAYATTANMRGAASPGLLVPLSLTI